MQDRYILVLNRSFWPDIEATGQFLFELCEDLAKRHKVMVIAGRSYYAKEGKFGLFGISRREEKSGISILRIRHTRFWKGNLLGRLINWLTFAVFAFLVALETNPRVVIVGTDPPFLGIIAMFLGKLKNVPFIYNCRDLFPDVAWGLGRLKKNSPLGRLYDYMNIKAFCSARFVVCLGQSMKNRLIAKGVPDEKIKIIPDWVDTSLIRPILKKDNPFFKELIPEDKFVVMYSGNIGLSQDLDVILRASKAAKESDSFCLVFLGEGAAKDRIKKQAGSLGMKNVFFLPYQPKEMLSSSLGAANLHIVSLKKGMAGAVVPSKVYGVLAAGRPYLAITDEESEAARIVREYGCGLWAMPGDIERISYLLDWALNYPSDLEEMGRKARSVAEAKYDKNIVIKEWHVVLEEVTENAHRST